MQSALTDIITPRLLLRLMGSEVITSILDGKLKSAESILNAGIPLELLESPSSLNFTQIELNNDSSYLPWSTRAIILKREPQMVGIIRFHGSPKPIELQGYTGTAVELGYRVFTKFRNDKYATEAVGAMMNWAYLQAGINTFVASVAPDNISSNRLISSLGFIKVAEVMDEIDGIEYVYLLKRLNK